jgi:hypothetical protein
VTIEKPMPIRSRPIPTVHRRSSPVKGSVLAVALFAGVVVVVGALLVVVGAVVVVGVLVSFDGDVPALGDAPVVGVGGVWL